MAMDILHEPTMTNGTRTATLLDALIDLKKGKSGVRLPSEWTGVEGKLADAFNEVVELNERMAAEMKRLNRVVGKEGRLSQRLVLGNLRMELGGTVETVTVTQQGLQPSTIVVSW